MDKKLTRQFDDIKRSFVFKAYEFGDDNFAKGFNTAYTIIRHKILSWNGELK